MSQHHVRIWKRPDTHIRPWEWRCTCQRWRPWTWKKHWTFVEAKGKGLAHAGTGTLDQDVLIPYARRL